jgi:hypothetical protein
MVKMMNMDPGAHTDPMATTKTDQLLRVQPGSQILKPDTMKDPLFGCSTHAPPT